MDDELLTEWKMVKKYSFDFACWVVLNKKRASEKNTAKKLLTKSSCCKELFLQYELLC
jgi:hypothetical protein